VGIVSSIVPVFSRRPVIGYRWLALATMATAVVGFGVWVHHMFATGIPAMALTFFSAASLLITIPSGVQVFAWISTILAGRPDLRTPMLFVLGFLFTFVIGGVTGPMFASVPFDQQVTDSYFVVAHFHYVLFGGAVFPIFGGLYYWIPKLYGRMYREGLGKLSFWLIFIGFNVTFFPMHISGLLGMPRRIYTYQPGLGWDVWNLMSSIGGYVLAAGILVVLVAWIHAAHRGERVGPNPWEAETLEWATASPPPDYDFAQIPTVRSREPLWDQPELRDLAHRVQERERALAEGHQTMGTSVLDADPEVVLEMPAGSMAPVVTAAGIALLFAGILIGMLPLALVGGAVAAGGLLAWFRMEEAHA
jgi:cytochrome c oxidase subunit I+III